jgi:tRNA pseudouridine38-40 synthase
LVTRRLKLLQKRFVLKLSFDGTDFNGWQIQPNGRTVQEELEKALSSVAKQKIVILGSGRTDSGVHAFNQYAHFDFPINMTTIQIQLALQNKLTKEIKIKNVFEVDNDFNARFSATQRHYKYFITENWNPFNKDYRSWFPRKKINYDLINNYINMFLGEHDFAGFSKPNPDLKHTRCNITQIAFDKIEDGYLFQIKANRFLHNMVRRIVGCLVTLSDKNYPPEIIIELLQRKQSDQILVPTAPPNGLFLWEVLYPDYPELNIICQK